MQGLPLAHGRLDTHPRSKEDMYRVFFVSTPSILSLCPSREIGAFFLPTSIQLTPPLDNSHV